MSTTTPSTGIDPQIQRWIDILSVIGGVLMLVTMAGVGDSVAWPLWLLIASTTGSAAANLLLPRGRKVRTAIVFLMSGLGALAVIGALLMFASR